MEFVVVEVDFGRNVNTRNPSDADEEGFRVSLRHFFGAGGVSERANVRQLNYSRDNLVQLWSRIGGHFTAQRQQTSKTMPPVRRGRVAGAKEPASGGGGGGGGGGGTKTAAQGKVVAMEIKDTEVSVRLAIQL